MINPILANASNYVVGLAADLLFPLHNDALENGDEAAVGNPENTPPSAKEDILKTLQDWLSIQLQLYKCVRDYLIVQTHGISCSEYRQPILEAAQNFESTKPLLDAISVISVYEPPSGSTKMENVRDLCEKRVLQFDRNNLADELSNDIVKTEDFRLFLALVDLPKGYLHKMNIQDPSKKKEMELFLSRLLVEEVFKSFDEIDPKTKKCLYALLNYDVLGSFLKGKITLEEAALQFREMTDEASIPPEEFLALLTVFAKTKHPVLISENQEKIEIMFQLASSDDSIEPRIENYSDELLHKYLGVTTKTAPKLACLKFLKALPRLTEFLNEQTDEIMREKDPDEASTSSKNGTAYKQIKHEMRDLLLLIGFRTGFPQIFEERGHLISAIRDMRLHNFDSSLLRPLIPFDAALINFRRSVLIRFSLDKLQELGLDLQERPRLPLLNLKWFHGTNSALFANLSNCDYQLLPSGELNKRNIVPFTGELRAGANECGINNESLSGTALPKVNISIDYASRPAFIFDLNSELLWLEGFLKVSDVASEQDCHPSRSDLIVRSGYAVRRLRKVYPSKYRELSDKIEERLKGLETQVETIQYSNSSYGARIREFKAALRSLRAAISADLSPFSDEEKEFLQDVFPLVMGSMTAADFEYYGMDGELLYKGPAKLGRDIQVIFSPEERIAQVEEFFKGRLPRPIEILGLEDLNIAHEMDKKLSPKFEAVISKTILARAFEDYDSDIIGTALQLGTSDFDENANPIHTYGYTYEHQHPKCIQMEQLIESVKRMKRLQPDLFKKFKPGIQTFHRSLCGAIAKKAPYERESLEQRFAVKRLYNALFY